MANDLVRPLFWNRLRCDFGWGVSRTKEKLVCGAVIRRGRRLHLPPASLRGRFRQALRWRFASPQPPAFSVEAPNTPWRCLPKGLGSTGLAELISHQLG